MIQRTPAACGCFGGDGRIKSSLLAQLQIKVINNYVTSPARVVPKRGQGRGMDAAAPGRIYWHAFEGVETLADGCRRSGTSGIDYGREIIE